MNDVETSEFFEKNQEMLNIFLKIRDGEIPHEDWRDKQDSIGFTPLHYAVMLQDKDIITTMLKFKFQFCGKKGYQQYQKKNVHDLVVWSEYLGLNLADEIFMRTSYEATTISRTITIEKAHLKAHEALLSMAKQSEGLFRRQMAAAKKRRDYPAYEKARRSLREAPNVIRNGEKGLRDIKENIRELNGELEELLSRNRSERKGRLRQFVKSKDPIDMKVREILNRPDILVSILSFSAREYTICYWHNVRLAVPKNWISESDRQFFAETENTTEREKVQKPYGNSWFSPEAHKDRSILKNEYRELAKKYHPDRYAGEEDSAEATKIFQEILGERMDILESLR